jgi:two-component system, response regulator, stage 0 sporulation protein F
MPRILVVDNEEHIRQFLELELTEAGYDVVSVARCMGALDKIETTRPHVVILDMMLVDTEGMELLQQIQEVYHEISIILLCSPYDNYNSVPKASTADSRVIKSHDLAELKMKVRRAVERNAAKVQSLPSAPSTWNCLSSDFYFS